MVQKAKDMATIGIHFDILPISLPNHLFDLSHFYGNLLVDLHGDDTAEMRRGLLRADELINAVRKKTTVKRALQRLPLRLANDLELSVSVYNLVQPATVRLIVVVCPRGRHS